MTTGALIIIALRLLMPLTILRWPLFGGIASMLLDALDVVLIELIGLGGFGDHYHALDKVLDSYYLTLELIVALRWDNLWMKVPALILFPYRMIGVVLFELTDRRIVLFLFPNMFENWWLYCVVVMRFFPSLIPRSWKTTLVPMLILLIPKMAQEYMLHFAELQPWDWIKRNVLGTS